MQKVGVPLLVCLVAIGAGPGRAQDATSPAPGPTIRVTTTEVALDLIVRDKKGRQVKNLKPGDVEIFEDGVRQQVLSFRIDRKSTRLNSSHLGISYAVFCLNDPPPTEIYPLPLHDALPIWAAR